MRYLWGIAWIAVCVGVLTATGCKEETAGNETAPDMAGEDAAQSATIGPEGGTVTLDGGASFVVPASSLSDEVTFALSWKSAPETLVPGITPVTEILQIGPSGTLFDPPATLQVPYDPSRLPAGDDPESVALYVSSGLTGDWQRLDTLFDGGVLTAEVTHLSEFAGAAGCRPNENGCYSGADCCSSVCWENSCAACRSSGQTCQSGFDCCDGLICEEGTCQACRAQGASCNYAADCCSAHASSCLNNTCQACLEAGASCVSFADCCGGMSCVEGVCTDGCAQNGQQCSADNDCCNHESDGVVCKGGACVPCDQPGQPCSLFSCCGQSLCLSDSCQACRTEGTGCESDISCCSGKCTDGKCRSCRTDGQECDGPQDCCSGTCTNNNCLACPGKGGACGADADCCPGSCCAELAALVCEDAQCSDCVRAGGNCSGMGTNCCGDQVCVSDLCTDCVPLGTECESDVHCCGYTLTSGIRCLSGTCQQCGFSNADCDAETPCCVEQCMQGKCRSCLPGGEACETDEECCDKSCVDNQCVACAGYMESCESLSCCGGLACAEGVCTCAIPGQDCSEIPCCPGEFCANNLCHSCASEDESCADEPCCPGLECGNGDECVDPDDPPPDGCSCNTPGVVVTKISGCVGWDDAEECSGWASVVTEYNGWDFTPQSHEDAMAYQVPSNTVLCAFDCCIKIECP